jgi:hypothetical protein
LNNKRVVVSPNAKPLSSFVKFFDFGDKLQKDEIEKHHTRLESCVGFLLEINQASSKEWIRSKKSNSSLASSTMKPLFLKAFLAFVLIKLSIIENKPKFAHFFGSSFTESGIEEENIEDAKCLLVSEIVASSSRITPCISLDSNKFIMHANDITIIFNYPANGVKKPLSKSFALG